VAPEDGAPLKDWGRDWPPRRRIVGLDDSQRAGLLYAPRRSPVATWLHCFLVSCGEVCVHVFGLTIVHVDRDSRAWG